MQELLFRMENNLAFEIFIADALKAQKTNPMLLLKLDATPELSGTIILKDGSGFEVDRYEIKIVANSGYPYYFPFVFETGGRIPINADWHVYENDGHLCLCTTTDEYIKTSNGLPLELFIKNELTPYLFNQTFRREKGFFLNEMDHGDKGQLDTLMRLLKTDNIMNVHWLLNQAKEGYQQDRTSHCFCKSGKKYRHCHRDILNTFKNLGKVKISALIKLVENSNQFKLLALNIGVSV